MNTINTQKGFTMLIAIITTSMLLIVSFVVINVALKQLVLADASEQSQFAFYAADSGTECAIYYDLKNPSGTSAFDSTNNSGSITCGTDRTPITTGSQSLPVPTSPQPTSVIGGPSSVSGSTATSVFYLTFLKGCAIVTVKKNLSTGDTTIDSRGYNTCNINSNRRYERGVQLVY